MKAKTISVIFVTTILALMWCSAAWADRSTIREYRQTQRVRQGIRSGEITRPEVLRLRKEQRRIDRAYHRASADGHLNRRERQRLDKLQNLASRHIYRAKHNPVHRRHAVMHNQAVNCYYPVANSRHGEGYAFSLGVSNIGWHFAFSGQNR